MQKLIRTEILSDIANAIRTRGRTNISYTPGQMAKAIRDVPESLPSFRITTEILESNIVPSINIGTLTFSYIIPEFVEV